MAMNKKEQAAFAELENKLAVAMALRWTEYVAPDVVPPSSTTERFRYGWLPSHSYEFARQAWSGAVSHGYSEPAKAGRNGSQNPRHLYSTRLLALRASRYELEKKFALELSKVDSEITKEIAAMSTPNKGESK